MSGAGAFEASTPAFAHTKPWRVRQMSTPRSARRTSLGLVEHDLEERGSLSCSPASASARAPGAHVGERHDRALGLGDDLVRDRRAAARRRGRSLPSAASDQRGEVVALAHLREAGEAARAEGAHARRSFTRAW